MAEEILGHNLEDVLGLGRIFEMLSYLCIYDSEYEVTYAELDDENLILELTLPYKLPQKFSNGNEQFYLTGEKETIKFIIKTTDGKLKQYTPIQRTTIIFRRKTQLFPKPLDPESIRNTGKRLLKIPAIPGLHAPIFF